MPRYLADTTIWAWAGKRTRLDIRRKLAERFARNEVVTCPPVVLEALHKPERGADYEAAYIQDVDPIDWLPLESAMGERATELQRQMARGSDGNHRRPAIDYLIAAVAEAAGSDYVLWHFDKDLRVICEHTGQPHEAEESEGPGR